MLLPSERFLADLAGVGRVARVLFHMVREVFFSRKRLLAELTAVRRLTRVYPGKK